MTPSAATPSLRTLCRIVAELLAAEALNPGFVLLGSSLSPICQQLIASILTLFKHPVLELLEEVVNLLALLVPHVSWKNLIPEWASSLNCSQHWLCVA